jgi:hypothetical protein
MTAAFWPAQLASLMGIILIIIIIIIRSLTTW